MALTESWLARRGVATPPFKIEHLAHGGVAAVWNRTSRVVVSGGQSLVSESGTLNRPLVAGASSARLRPFFLRDTFVPATRPICPPTQKNTGQDERLEDV